MSESLKIHENVFSTGELGNMEQSMVVRTKGGLVLITGCSHPEMVDILKVASRFGKVKAIVGGLHGFSEFWLFRDLELICPADCTQTKAELKAVFPEKYVKCGVGKIIEF